MSEIRKNDLVTVEIQDLAYGGLGVARHNGFVVFVPNALPGERVAARIVKKKANHAQAVLERIEQASPHRIANPPCPVYDRCGGCTWQNLPHEEQTRWKEKQVVDTLRHLGRQEAFETRPILRSPLAFRYRNKMEYSWGMEPSERHGAPQLVLGFHKPGRFDRILPVPACLLQPEALDEMHATLLQWAREQGFGAHDPRRHEGFLRHAVMRYSFTTGENILLLLTHEGDLTGKEQLVERLRERVGGFKAFVWGINRGVADVARIEEERWVWGNPILEEEVNGLRFEISPQSFFQTNTAGAALLYAKVAELAELAADSRLLDAYCGTGAIGLHCARQAGRVVGVEMVTEAIWNARRNAERNGIDNTVFLAAPMPRGLELARCAAGGAFSHVVIDPPRGGMDKRSLAGLIDLQAPTFLYVSCNPATLARDIVTICEGGYVIDVVQPVDMFPQTYHIETIVRLRRRDG
ncbi:MAG TPA: 23S rRNA (uracil(1939)-C(5))-methyltransferase RlmD [Candidatus Sumerlaeota bacterium]|nr:23S rRNA (uracil(1939)-C(5))-methyltransferase RlmD [Candidatus Sumerlaeota bacterium]HOR27893.1 23S rRNA (uracil(1939)-C(5))-methyltransferase RlmD [Candidatus Sumerlaeota bacterium]HPK03802.1 23S rRNA (uracil(1939)-C(5))-methyltransferase RlmD [Candidatus Sumerlaeota bacterium]